uniref:Uncharacterized protein n=1 Tax=Picea sitchensis TaxID=3332 RepID=D5A888_PICSI|nr:unknown [Picea sitchensis]
MKTMKKMMRQPALLPSPMLQKPAVAALPQTKSPLVFPPKIQENASVMQMKMERWKRNSCQMSIVNRKRTELRKG